jgi:membrane dipeptidase
MRDSNVDSRAMELHRQAIVIDGHSDILIPVADGKMRLADRVDVPDPAAWEIPLGLTGGAGSEFGLSQHTCYFGPMGQYDIPRLLEGGVTIQVCAVYVEDSQLDWSVKRGLQMVWHLHNETAQNKDFELVTTVTGIRRVKAEGKCGVILSFEGCEALGSDLHLLDLYYQLGLRIASLTHCRRNVYADGPQVGVTTGGLTSLGKQAIRRMNELGIVVDLVHINEVGFWEILDLTTAPVVLSHSSGTMFAAAGQESVAPLGLPGRPGLVLPRDRIRLEAIAANGGVLGVISFYKQTLDDVIADIELALEVMGPDHVGLGSDLYGLDMAPVGLEDISKVPAITRRLVQRGHSDEVILKVLGGNYLRVFEQAWRG